MSIRTQLNAAISGETIKEPVYLVYDWFVKNRDIDWEGLFDLGLGQINHASLIEISRPNLEIKTSESQQDGHTRKDIWWITPKGRLHEWYLDGWRQEYLIKSPHDYKIMASALAGSQFKPTEEYFKKSEEQIGDQGITVGQFGLPRQIGHTRTPFQVIQIDMAGLERFSIDIAMETPELLDLLELMNTQLIAILKTIRPLRVTHLKLWENLSIETMGPALYRKHLVPVYQQVLDILEGTGKRLQVHYDGKLRAVAEDILHLGFDGLDSLTPRPEGDLTIEEARHLWPDTFFWLHPSLTWDSLSDEELSDKIKNTARHTGMKRFCFQLSEEVPLNWQRTVPLILKTLKELS